MTRELRYNLIFLAIFLAISLPGAIMLFKKKLDPTAAPMYLPAPAYNSRLFNDPAPAPRDVTRLVPPQTSAWLDEMRPPNSDSSLAVALDPPVIDSTRTVQLLSLSRDGTAISALLLLWDTSDPAAAQRLRIHVATSADMVNASLQDARRVPLPIAVRRELMDRGYVNPPAAVVALDVQATVEDSSATLENLLVTGGESRLISIEAISGSVPTSAEE